MLDLDTFVIAIDGPAGAGKSTIARLLALHLNSFYLDTGAMYRAVTFHILHTALFNNTDTFPISISDSEKLGFSQTHIRESIQKLLAQSDTTEGLLKSGDLIFSNHPDPLTMKITLGNKDITEKIRYPIVSLFVSQVAASPIIRKFLVELQQRIGSRENFVIEGRDIGSRVFPNTPYKFFVTAGVEERARRRFEELAKKGIHQDLEDLKKEISDRDRGDSSRKDSPLIVPDGSLEIDTTHLSPEQVVERIQREIGRQKEIARKKG